MNDDGLQTRFLACTHCNMFTPKRIESCVQSLKGGEVDMSVAKKKVVKKKPSTGKSVESSFNPEKSLQCDKCKAIKRAGKKRIEKWKNTKYLCRECRPSKKKEKKS